MIQEVEGGFVASAGGVRLPGVFVDRRAARYAFYFTNGELAGLSSPIETADLLRLREARLAKGDHPHRSGRAAKNLKCRVEDCGDPRISAELCQTHYSRVRHRGTTDPAPNARGTREERFWRHVDRTPNGCWLWAGATGAGYGSFRHQRKNYRAHRISWEIHHGPIPASLFVLHACDVKLCVNPAHLSLGTDEQNRQEAVARGLTPRKLNEEKVRAIRLRRRRGETLAGLARAFGVAVVTIGKVVNRESWAHVQ